MFPAVFTIFIHFSGGRACIKDYVFIDPPYNTGSDAFVYDDDSSISGAEFSEISGQRDEYGNLLFDMRANNESNGRFHTDWLRANRRRHRSQSPELMSSPLLLSFVLRVIHQQHIVSLRRELQKVVCEPADAEQNKP